MIIWLPERMNAATANKLLKILEEPPSNTVFLLVSENPDALLATIVSRTQRINVPPIETKKLSEELQKRFSLSVDEANTVARLSMGNFVKALENLDTTSEKSALFENFISLMRATYSRKIFDIEKWVQNMSGLSRDSLKNFFIFSIGMLRDSFIYNFDKSDLVVLTEKEVEFVKKFHTFINYENVALMVEELELAHAHIEQNGNAKIVLFDMAVKFITFFKN